MAFRTESGDDLTINHEINVTPFIDVILVLLIVFMVAAPLATVDVPVDLPKSTAAPQPRPDQPIFVTLKADRTLAISDMPVAREALGGALDAASGRDRDTRLFFRADSGVSYGEVMEVMNLLRATGYTKVALVALDVRQGT